MENKPNVAHLTRQLDIIPVACLGEQITVIGAGAIGSFVVLALAKMGFTNIVVLDDDKVDVENMSCSLYGFEDIGKPKVQALAEIIERFTKTKIEAIAKKYEGGIFNGVVVSAVDSMAVRRMVWENHVGKAPATKAIIDPRMGAEFAHMYVMQPMDDHDAKSYAASLYTDEAAVQERCTAKATIYTAEMLSGLVSKAVKDVAMGVAYPRTTFWDIAKSDLKSWSSKSELN